MTQSHKLTLSLAPDITLELVYIRTNEFLMGSNRAADPKAADNELPQHKLFLNAYFIGRTPVTVAQFAVFVQATGYRTTAEQYGHGYNLVDGRWKEIKDAQWRFPHGSENIVQQKSAHPVTLVSWYDALAFCNWLTDMTQFQVYLPSEAEWEQAARGTDGQIYPWGNEEPTDTLCNFNLNVKDTTPVGQYSPQGDSPAGCADMAGNVIEWTRSLWGVDLHTPEFNYPYSEREPEREDIQAPDDVRRVVRGGGWDDDYEGVRAAFRLPNPPISRNDILGFRVASPGLVSLHESLEDETDKINKNS
jgi:formylglycine-generating enzyme required for sulfatase activity